MNLPISLATPMTAPAPASGSTNAGASGAGSDLIAQLFASLLSAITPSTAPAADTGSSAEPAHAGEGTHAKTEDPTNALAAQQSFEIFMAYGFSAQPLVLPVATTPSVADAQSQTPPMTTEVIAATDSPAITATAAPTGTAIAHSNATPATFAAPTPIAPNVSGEANAHLEASAATAPTPTAAPPAPSSPAAISEQRTAVDVAQNADPTSTTNRPATPAAASKTKPKAAATVLNPSSALSAEITTRPRTSGNEPLNAQNALATNVEALANAAVATSASTSKGRAPLANTARIGSTDGAAQAAAILNANAANQTKPTTISTPALSTTVEVAPTPPAVNQVVQAIEPMRHRADGSYHVKIELNPHNLGRVELTMELRDGVLAVHINADHSATQRMLHEHIDVLRELLAERGVATGSVDVGDHNASRQAASQRDLAAQRESQRQTTSGRDRDSASNIAATTDSSALIPQRATTYRTSDPRLDVHA